MEGDLGELEDKTPEPNDNGLASSGKVGGEIDAAADDQANAPIAQPEV